MYVPYWTHRNRFGLWAIAYSTHDRRWHPMHEDVDLGSYPTPEMALDDLVGGHSDFPAYRMDPANCELPEELGDWTQVKSRF
jgi:hypothetical protein